MTEEELRRTILLLQEELANTNHEVVALALELEQRVDDLAQANEALRTEITERRKVEREREGLHEALQRAYNELRESQEKLVQQERLRALGQMASGIAHDINNALSPASIYAQSLLERDQTLNENAREALRIIHRAIDDVGQTVSRMRSFYRQREPELQLAPVDVNVLVQQVADMTRARWHDIPQERGIVIGVKIDLAPNLPHIMGAENEIRDALTNLVFNAVDAMPEGGTLTLRSATAEPMTTQPGATPTRRVRVEVGDTGVGMTEAVRSRCLEPFFTTKGDRGSGLGLAMVYGMVKRHSADLEIASKPGAGTTVQVVFPVAALPDSHLPAASAHAPRPLRILLVDDEPLLLKSLRDALASEGHSLTAAEGGQRGIDEFFAARRRGEPFEVVITDLGMPTVDGRTVAAAIKFASPDTPVILLTGWGQRLHGEGKLPEHVDRVLGKPPRLSELRAALAELARARP
jgi:signal transduction histidine kinase/ActR/RegA family two-component response regulator